MESLIIYGAIESKKQADPSNTYKKIIFSVKDRQLQK